ncbi:MAG: NAD(P)/FAD-dependent oxidoreductase [Bacteroidales bacterium]|nr:NAD(P)/FAD-dependent oxidoreductase [Bacteroidales bacterium]
MEAKVTIIGAGVIGLAIAEELSKKFNKIFVVEKNKKFGQETSSRNSEVIHSGIYYPTNSLKAKLCVEGNKMLYDFCIKHGIPHSRCGKLVVATNLKEEMILNKILNQAIRNGVKDGQLISREKALELEPEIFCTKALHFPSTGIIDSHGLMKRLEANATINGVSFAYNSEVVKIERIEGGYAITVKENNIQFIFTTEYVINASGLNADQIAKIAGAFQKAYKIHYWKGDYFAVGNGKNKKINRLIYPVPQTNVVGLGIHATLDLNHGMKLGPDSTYLQSNTIDYSIDKKKQTAFLLAAQKYLPFLEFEDLHPDQAGVRPKLQLPGEPVRDFIITKETASGHPNFINLIGLESPGLTSCLSIGHMISKLLDN